MPPPFKASAICGAVVILARRHCTFERPLAPTATSIARFRLAALRRIRTCNSSRWMSSKVKGFGRRPLRRWAGPRGRRPKASQGGNRGEVGGRFGARAYGDLRIADGWRARRRRPAALGVFGGSADSGRFRWRRCAGARRSPRSKEVCRGRAGVAFVSRRAAGGGGDRRCAAGCGATVMSCRS